MQTKPNSVFSGVRIGCITYSYRGGADTAEYTLECLLKDGLSETELMDGPIRSYAGIPGRPGKRQEGRRRRRCPAATDRCRPAQGARDATRQVRASCEKCTTMPASTSTSTRSPSARPTTTSTSISRSPRPSAAKRSPPSATTSWPKRLAPFAEKHKIWVAFHNHTNNIPTIESIDPLMQIGDYIGFNFDIGHYVAGTKGKSPIPVIEKYHDKIISLHLKDRTADGANLPWGEGQTPIKEVLQLLKKEKWPIYADIEAGIQNPGRLHPGSRSRQVRPILQRSARLVGRHPPTHPPLGPRVLPGTAPLPRLPSRLRRTIRSCDA